MIQNLTQTLGELETEVTETLENPYRTYSVKFPYSVSFSFPDDDHHTQITIQSTSEILRYGRDEQDIQSQMKLDHEHVQSAYAKHIIKWVGERLWDTDVRETAVTYGDNLTIKVMTDEQIDQFREDCLNDE
jgi:hypothetical protein